MNDPQPISTAPVDGTVILTDIGSTVIRLVTTLASIMFPALRPCGPRYPSGSGDTPMSPMPRYEVQVMSRYGEWDDFFFTDRSDVCILLQRALEQLGDTVRIWNYTTGREHTGIDENGSPIKPK